MATDIAARRGQVVSVAAVRPGDKIRVDGQFRTVTAIQRARGRKPAVGENLYLITDRGAVKANSAAAIRLLR